MRPVRKSPMSVKLAILGILACVSLAGCIGKTPPVEEYLRLGQSAGDCAVKNAQDGLTLAIKAFNSLDNLSRQAVLTAKGRVLTPSLYWYWEASPEALVDQAIIANAPCVDGVAGIVEYRSRVVHDAGLSGTVTAFNLQEDGGLRFVVAARLELWAPNYTKLLASTVVRGECPVAALDAQSVADAASKALGEITADAMAWLDQSKPLIEQAKLNKENPDGQ